jgi:hypothetical protein
MNWALALPGDGSALAAQRTFQDWAERDFSPAMEWICSHVSEEDSPPLPDIIVASLVADSPLSNHDPRLAVEWSDWIEDHKLRAESIEKLFQVWARQDAPAAARYVAGEKSRWTEEQKQTLLEAIHHARED